MVKPKISIIIPVYNIEKYLKQCLDSVINQTLREIEIICVNDGSTDNSLQILQEYSRKDDRIKLFSKENGGIGSARNEGLKHVNGEYIGFVDSDDWIELDMYEKLYEKAEANDCDMVICSAHIFDDIEQEFKFDKPYFTLACFDESFDDIIFNHEQTAGFLFEINVTPWNKIYRTSLIKDNNITFQKLDFEDNPFFYECFLKSKRVSLVRENLYFYRVNRKGSFITTGNRRFFDIIPTHQLNEKIIRDNCPFYLDSFFNFKINTIISRYNQVDKEFKDEFFDIIKEDFIEMDSKDIQQLSDLNFALYQNFLKSKNPEEYELHYQIIQLKSEEQKLKKYNAQLKKQNADYQEKIKKNNHIINEMRCSNSWKITKPLRKLTNSFKNLKMRIPLKRQNNN